MLVRPEVIMFQRPSTSMQMKKKVLALLYQASLWRVTEHLFMISVHTPDNIH